MAYGEACASTNRYGDLTGDVLIKDEGGKTVYSGQFFGPSIDSVLRTYGWRTVSKTNTGSHLKLTIERV